MILVIAEKTDAAKQIATLLGTGKPTVSKVSNATVYEFSYKGETWKALGTMGHIMELDYPGEFAGNKRWSFAKLPELVNADLIFVEDAEKEKTTIAAIKSLAKQASEVVLATDFDREGELIAADVYGVVREANQTVPCTRARYSAFTKAEITHSFDNLTVLDQKLADAGATRRDVDFVWGTVLTRYLSTAKYGSTRSAGRVQTPTLALIVDREKERNAFVPEDYWVIKANFSAKKAYEGTHQTERFKSEAEAQAVMDDIAAETTGTVASIERKTRKINPPTPFDMTSLQIAAAAEGIKPKMCMSLAETLYLQGYITYPRTDNTVYPPTADLGAVVKALRANPAYEPTCVALLAKDHLSATRGKRQTTDHPPIYPLRAANPEDLNAQQYKLYNLIARRFLATLSEPATVEDTVVRTQVASQIFVSKGEVTIEAGFRAIYPFGVKKDAVLPALTTGQVVDFLGATCTKKQTEPPARYSQGRLIAEMEKLGLGTKSTRASIIDRLEKCGYIEGDPVVPTELGCAVISVFESFAPRIASADMTASLEDEMLSIIDGKLTREGVFVESRALLARELDNLIPAKDQVKEILGEASKVDAQVGTCPNCGKRLLIRSGRFGSFVGCEGYPTCKTTYNLPSGKIAACDEPCPKCGGVQVLVIKARTKPMPYCLNKDCMRETNAQRYEDEQSVVVGMCPVCGEAGIDAHLVTSRNMETGGRSLVCENVASCKQRFPLPREGEIIPEGTVCEVCGLPLITTDSRRGPWTHCPNPKCASNAKAPKASAAKTSTAKSSATTKKSSTKSSKTSAGTKAKASGTKTSAAKASGTKASGTKTSAAKKSAKASQE